MVGVPSFMLGVGADMIMVTLGTDTGLCFVSGLASAQQWAMVTSSPPVCSPLPCHAHVSHLPSTRKVQKYLSR